MAIENGPFIGDLPIKKCTFFFFRSYVSLPECRVDGLIMFDMHGLRIRIWFNKQLIKGLIFKTVV
jgi:hypothetical protein